MELSFCFESLYFKIDNYFSILDDIFKDFIMGQKEMRDINKKFGGGSFNLLQNKFANKVFNIS